LSVNGSLIQENIFNSLFLVERIFYAHLIKATKYEHMLIIEPGV